MHKELAIQATAAMQRAARFGIGPISKATVDSIGRALAGLTDAAPSCPDRDHPRNDISCPDDHVQGGD